MKSARNAIKSGFRPAWVEMTVKPAEMIDEMNNAEVVEGIALRYVELAYDFPNLYKYLYMSEQDGEKMASTARALRAENQDKVMQMLKREHGISVEAAEKFNESSAVCTWDCFICCYQNFFFVEGSDYADDT